MGEIISILVIVGVFLVGYFVGRQSMVREINTVLDEHEFERRHYTDPEVE